MSGLTAYSGAAVLLAGFGLSRILIAVSNRFLVKGEARKVFERRKALYTEAPKATRLERGELPDERMVLDIVSDALVGFTLLADYVDVYDEGSALAWSAKTPYRALVDDAKTTTALIFQPPGTKTVRIHLQTELPGLRWISTQNDRGAMVAKSTRPDSVDVEHVTPEMKPRAMAILHAARLARSTDASEAILIESFDDYVASHRRYWDSVRAFKKATGWVTRAEIQWPAWMNASLKELLFREIERLIDEDRQR